MKHFFCVAVVFPLFVGCLTVVNTPPPVLEKLPDGTSVLILRGHTDAVLDVAFSPDGKKIVSASADLTARIWDAETGKHLKTLKGHLNLEGREDVRLNTQKSVVWATAFSPDGKTIATAGTDGTVRFWDVESGKELKKFEVPHRDVPAAPSVYALTAIQSIAFSPDGKMIVTGNRDSTVHLYDVASGKQLQVLLRQGFGSGVRSVSFSPDGKKFIEARTGRVLIWDAETNVWTGEDITMKNLLQMLENDHRGSFSSAVFSPDGKKIATTSIVFAHEPGTSSSKMFNGSLQVWSTDFQSNFEFFAAYAELLKAREHRDLSSRREFLSGEKLLLLTLEGYGGRDVAFSPDGKKIATAGCDGIVRIVDVESGEELKKLEGHIVSVASNFYSPDGTFVAFSPDGKRIATGAEDKTVRIWTLE